MIIDTLEIKIFKQRKIEELSGYSGQIRIKQVKKLEKKY